MNILGALGILGGGGSGGGSGGSLTLTTTTVTLDTNGEALIPLTNAHLYSVVSMEFVENLDYLSVLERISATDATAIHIRSSATTADAGLNVVVTYGI